MTNTQMSPLVVGIVGDSGSGKSTLCKGVRALLGPNRVAEVKLDDYQRYSREERRAMGITALNPAAHDLALMEEHLRLLRRGVAVRNRSYEHANGTFGAIRSLEPGPFLLVRGLLGFPTAALRDVYHLRVALAPEPDLLFRWKMRRDMNTRGYSEAEVLTHIAQHMVDAKEHVFPQFDHADLVIRYDVPEWDAPDDQVRTTVVARGVAAAALRENGLAAAPAEIWTVEDERETELVFHLSHPAHPDVARKWTGGLFPHADILSDEAGSHQDEQGGYSANSGLLVLQGLIAAVAAGMQSTL